MEDDMATNQAELIQQTYDENIKKLDRGIYELQEALKACEDVEQRKEIERDLNTIITNRQEWKDFYRSKGGKV